MRATVKTDTKIKLPPAHDWRTTDADEVNKRRQLRPRAGHFPGFPGIPAREGGGEDRRPGGTPARN